MTRAPWAFEHHAGRAGSFHARDLPDPAVRAVWWFEVTEPAVVLGSTQPWSLVDRAVAETAGIEVVRRRSGGGAVWLEPGGATWIDVVLPRGDRLWLDDVSRSSRWLGDLWVEVLARLGHPGAVVHDGPMARPPGSDLVCFAGLAPGEVTLGGRKVVGIAQRRSRLGARFQCAVPHTWDPRPLVDTFDLAPGEGDALVEQVAPLAVGIGQVGSSAVVDELLAVLAAT